MSTTALQLVKQTLPAMNAKGELGLPKHVSIERFINAASAAVLATRDLDQCSPQSLIGSLRKAAIDGLLPDGREAAIVVFKGRNGPQAQYMPMVAGLLKLARQSGEVASVSCHVVYAHDYFRLKFGDGECIEHEPKLDGERGPPVGAYAIGKTKDGSVYREYMTIDDIDKVRAVSRAANGGPWVDWWERMAEKTVLRRLLKRMPTATDVLDALEREDEQYREAEVVTAAPVRMATGLHDKLAAAKSFAPPPQADVDPDTGETIPPGVGVDYPEPGADG